MKKFILTTVTHLVRLPLYFSGQRRKFFPREEAEQLRASQVTRNGRLRGEEESELNTAQGVKEARIVKGGNE